MIRWRSIDFLSFPFSFWTFHLKWETSQLSKFFPDWKSPADDDRQIHTHGGRLFDCQEVEACATTVELIDSLTVASSRDSVSTTSTTWTTSTATKGRAKNSHAILWMTVSDALSLFSHSGKKENDLASNASQTYDSRPLQSRYRLASLDNQRKKKRLKRRTFRPQDEVTTAYLSWFTIQYI